MTALVAYILSSSRLGTSHFTFISPPSALQVTIRIMDSHNKLEDALQSLQLDDASAASGSVVNAKLMEDHKVDHEGDQTPTSRSKRRI